MKLYGSEVREVWYQWVLNEWILRLVSVWKKNGVEHPQNFWHILNKSQGRIGARFYRPHKMSFDCSEVEKEPFKYCNALECGQGEPHAANEKMRKQARRNSNGFICVSIHFGIKNPKSKYQCIDGVIFDKWAFCIWMCGGSAQKRPSINNAALQD